MLVRILCMVVVCCWVCSARNALATPYIATDYYHAIGPSENLVAKFDHSVEATSANKYTGLLLVDISKFGWKTENEAFDAFYYFINSDAIGWVPRKDGQAHHIAFGGNTVPTGGSTYVGDNVSLYPDGSVYQIVFNDDVGFCSGPNIGCIPTYRPDHVYEYVLQINTPTSLINFGFGDADPAAKSGEYDITITPVALGETITTPEPASLLLLLSSLIGLGLIKRQPRIKI